jgi:hypothetical protein
MALGAIPEPAPTRIGELTNRMKRAPIPKARPKSPDSDDISFSMSDISHSSERPSKPASKKNTAQAKPINSRTVTNTMQQGAGSRKAESFSLSGSDLSIDFSDEFQPKVPAKKVPSKPPSQVSRLKDNSAAAIMSFKKVETKPKMSASESFSISGDEIDFSDEEVPVPAAKAQVQRPARAVQAKKSQRKSESLSFSISGDDIEFSDEDMASRGKLTPQSKLYVGNKVKRTISTSKPDPRASIDSDDIHFSGDSDSNLSGGPKRTKSGSVSSRRVAESNMKLSHRASMSKKKANNRYTQEDESITPSHTPSLDGE